MSKRTKSGIIEVEKEDIELANKIAVEILGKTLDELSIPSRNLLELLEKMLDKRVEQLKEKDSDRIIKRSDITFTRRDIREYTAWTNTRLHTHLKELISMEYVIMINGRTNSLQTYRLIYDGQGKQGEKFIPGFKNNDV
jgi:hypothetical protein